MFLTALVAPVGTAILTSLETSAAVQVAPAAANRLIGAEYPLLIDTNGDGSITFDELAAWYVF